MRSWAWWIGMGVGACAAVGTPDVVDVGTGPDDGQTATEGPADPGGPDDTDRGDTDVDDSDGADTDAADTDAPPVTDPCAGRVVGTEVGQCAPDFVLTDVNGVAHRLRDHAGDVIVIDVSTMWCPHCQNLADDLEAVHTTYGPQGVTVITVLHEDTRSQPPDAEDLRTWIDAFGISHLVLADPDATVHDVFGRGYQPNGLVIGRDGVVTWRADGAAVAAGVEAAVVAAL